MTVLNQNDRAAWLQGPSAVCSMLPDGVEIPWRLVLLGAPGVGKGTQASLLYERLSACHLSTGDVFRAAGSRSGHTPSPAMAAAMECMRSGALVPDTLVWDMVRERGGCLHCQAGFILDGFPRTLAQAEALHLFMQQEGIALSGVIDYELPLDEIVARLSGRRICKDCKAIFHVAAHDVHPLTACDRCGGALYQREDDLPASVAVRMQVYQSSTAPLIEFYRKLGLLVPVAAGGSPEEIYARTISALQKQSERSRLDH